MNWKKNNLKLLSYFEKCIFFQNIQAEYEVYEELIQLLKSKS